MNVNIKALVLLVDFRVDRPRIFKKRPSASACNNIEKKPPFVPIYRPYYGLFFGVRLRLSFLKFRPSLSIDELFT